MTAGERLSDCYFDEFHLVNFYGTSESGYLSSFVVDRKYQNTPIGTPLPGIEFVARENGALDAICTTCKEYIGLPEKTAEIFERLPDGRTLYHTGDCVELDAEGRYLFKNRTDWMVKVNGQRVETLEVENVICEMEGVKNAAVKAFTDADGQVYLAAYYVPENDVTEGEVRRFLSRKVPSYMVPRFFVSMKELPLTVSGKLDRVSLPAPSIENYKKDYVAPQNEKETLLCSAFSAVLACGEVGTQDEFFALGGDSIKVLKLVAQMNDAGYQLQTEDVLAL